MRLLRIRVPLAAVGLVAAGLAVVSTTEPAQAAFTCTMPATDATHSTYTWTGGGGADHAWTNPANWSPAVVPNDNVGGNPSLYDGNETSRTFVCIGDGHVVDVGGVTVKLESMDLGASTLNVVTGGSASSFFLMGSVPAVARDLSTIKVTGAEFGGSNDLRVSGDLVLGTGGVVATLEPAKIVDRGNTAAPTTGTLTVEDGGKVAVNGPTNVLAAYRIVVRGRVTLAGTGYISADHGSTFELRPHAAGPGVGILEFTNDGHYYEGSDPLSIPGLSSFVNEGAVLKSGGTFSGIYAAYQHVGAGRVDVTAGTLLIPNSDQPVHVAPSATYGTGTCEPWTNSCTPSARSNDRQNVAFTPNGTDTDGVTVELVEGPGLPRASERLVPPDTIGEETEVKATGIAMSRSAPAAMAFVYDASQVVGLTPADIMIERQPTGGSYGPLPDCDSGSIPSAPAVACVDRLASQILTGPPVGDADDAGDIQMVVRTIATSRWIGRRDGPAQQAAHQVSGATRTWDAATQSLTVGWTAPSRPDGLLRYVVTVDGSTIATPDPTMSQVVLSNLSPGPHQIGVTADYSGYVRPPATTSVVIPGQPGDVIGQWVRSLGGIQVSWTAPSYSEGLTGYDILNAASEVIATAGNEATSTFLTTLPPGSRIVRVRARYGDVIGAASSSPGIRVPHQPGAIDAKWSDQSLAATVSWTGVPSTADLLGYTVFVDGVAVGEAVDTSTTVAGLTAGKYLVGVAARYTGGVVGLERTTVLTVSEPLTGRVTGLKVSSGTKRSGPGVTISWKPPTYRLAYLVDYRVVASCPRRAKFDHTYRNPTTIQVSAARNVTCTVSVFARNKAKSALSPTAKRATSR